MALAAGGADDDSAPSLQLFSFGQGEDDSMSGPSPTGHAEDQLAPKPVALPPAHVVAEQRTWNHRLLPRYRQLALWLLLKRQRRAGSAAAPRSATAECSSRNFLAPPSFTFSSTPMFGSPAAGAAAEQNAAATGPLFETASLAAFASATGADSAGLQHTSLQDRARNTPLPECSWSGSGDEADSGGGGWFSDGDEADDEHRQCECGACGPWDRGRLF